MHRARLVTEAIAALPEGSEPVDTTLLDLVHRGLGIALVPAHVAAKPQAAGLVTLQLPPESTPEWVVSAITGAPAAASAPLLLDLLDADLALSA